MYNSREKRMILYSKISLFLTFLEEVNFPWLKVEFPDLEECFPWPFPDLWQPRLLSSIKKHSNNVETSATVEEKKNEVQRVRLHHVCFDLSSFNISCKETLKLTRYLHANCHNDPWCHKLLQYLTRDICIMKRTTNDRNPSRFNTLGPSRTLLISCISQKKLCSQSRNWEFRKLTKWRISAQEGSGIPQLLCEQKGVA